MTATLVGYWLADRDEERDLVKQFELRVDWRVTDLADDFNAYRVPQFATTIHVAAQNPVDLADFGRFTKAVRGSGIPVEALDWVPLVTRAQRPGFESSMGFPISERTADGKPTPAADRDEYAPIVEQSRFGNVQSNVGYDLLSEPYRRHAADLARDTGTPHATIVPQALTPVSPTYISFWPIYDSGYLPSTVVERRARLRGFVIGVYRVIDVLNASVAETPAIPEAINLYVSDASIDDGAGPLPALPIVTFSPSEKTFAKTSARPYLTAGTYRFVRSFVVMGQRWSVESIFPPEAIPFERTAVPLIVLFAGLLVTGLISAYVARARAQVSQVRALVGIRTLELAGSNAKLEKSNMTLEAVFDASPIAIIARDSARNVTAWNRAAEQLFGYEAAELVGHAVPDGVAPDPAEWVRRFERVATGETLRGIETRRQTKDGKSIDTMSSLAPFFDSTGALQGTVCTIVNITERNAIQRQLQQAQKMEAVGHLTGGLAHDFNNLLGVVLGNLDFLAEKQAVGSDQRTLTEAAIHAAMRGAELTRQLLAFARQQPLASKLTDLNAVLEGSTKLLRRTLGEQIMLESHLSEGLWLVLVDAAQLESAILNLAVNARDAMPSGGRLTLEARNITLDEGAAELNPEAAPGDYVAIAVSDTGSGIDPEIVAKVFDPFFTTKGSKGTGLGLSMVHGFIKQSGGHTKIYSEVGRGTTIRMYLPRARDEGVGATANATTVGRSGGNEVILVVEDNEGLRDVALRQLQGLGYRTIPAADGAQALEIVRGGAPIDLLFTDMVMPGGIDGRALAEAACRLRPGLRVLFTSGFTAAAASAAMAEEFGFNLLSKPYRKEELGRRIRSIIDGREG